MTDARARLKEILARLRALDEPVPSPAPLPTEAEVRAAEAELGGAFHPDYRAFLLTASNVTLGALEPCTLLPEGAHTDLVATAREAWNVAGVPRDLLPICSDNADYYCLTSGGAVMFWCHQGSSQESWPSLADWIEQVWIGRH